MKRVYETDGVCIGCGFCRVNCQMEHSRFKDPVKVFKRFVLPVAQTRR